MLEIKHIIKSFGKKQVLKDIHLTLENGIYGLLGVNGAGKTTLIHIVTGLLEADGGAIWYQGEDIKKNKKEFRNQLGFMPQYADYYANFSAKEFLKYICVIKGIPSKRHKKIIYDLLERVNLENEANNKLGTFSGGMRQRIGIAQAIINEPKLLILDEPTAGLDPVERIRFRNLISHLAVDRIIIMATHIVQDIESIANKIVLLHDGEILACEKPKQLIHGMKGKVGLIYASSNLTEKIMSDYVVSNLFMENEMSKLRVVSDHLKEGVELVENTNLEDYFLLKTGTRGQ